MGIGKAHLHREGEDAALVLSIRVHLDCAMVHPHQVLADHQAHANALVVELGRPSQLAKKRKQLGDVFLPDALASVVHVHFQHAFTFVESHNDANMAAQRELQRVLREIYQRLLQTDVVAVEQRRQRALGHNALGVSVVQGLR